MGSAMARPRCDLPFRYAFCGGRFPDVPRIRHDDQEIAIDNLQYIDYSEYMITTKPKKGLKTMTTNTVKRGRGKSAKAANLQIDFLKLAITHFGEKSKFKNPEMLAFGRTQKQFKKGSWNWIFAPKYRVGRGEYQLPELSAFTTFRAIVVSKKADPTSLTAEVKRAFNSIAKTANRVAGSQAKKLDKPSVRALAPVAAHDVAYDLSPEQRAKHSTATKYNLSPEDEKMANKILMRLANK